MTYDTFIPAIASPRRNKFPIFGWFCWPDLIILLIVSAIVLPIAFCVPIGLWGIIGVIVGGVVLIVILTLPINTKKLWEYAIDFFIYLISKKQYTKQEAQDFLNPVSKIEKNHMYSKNGQIASFYEICPDDIRMMSDSITQNRIDAFIRANKTLNDIIYEFNVISVPFNFQSKIESLNLELKKYNKKCHEYKTLILKIKMLESIMSKSFENSNGMFKKYFLIFKSASLNKNIGIYEKIRDEFSRACFYLNPADEEDLWIRFNKNFGLDLNNRKLEINHGIKFGIRSIKFDNNNFETLIIDQLPKQQLDAFWLNELLEIEDVTISIQVQPFTNEKKRNRFLDKLKDLTLARRQKGKTDIEKKQIEFQFAAINELVDSIAKGNEDIRLVKISVSYSATNDKEFKTMSASIKRQIKRCDMEFNEMPFHKLQAWQSSYPFVFDELDLDAETIVGTKALGLSYPFNNVKFIDDKGNYLGFRDNGNPFFLDFYLRDNKRNSGNAIYLGATGMRKTTGIKKNIVSAIVDERVEQIIVIDPEKDYKLLASNFKMQYIDMSGLGDTAINPCQILKTTDGDEDKDNKAIIDLSLESRYRLHLSGLLIYLKTLLTVDGDPLSSSEATFLNKIIKNTYAKHKITPTTNFDKIKNDKWIRLQDIYDYLLTEIKQIQKNKMNFAQYEIASKIRDLFEPFVNDGINAIMCNRHTNVNFKTKLIVLDIQRLLDSAIDNQVKRAQMYSILKYLDSIVLNHRSKFPLADDKNAKFIQIFVDEFHVLADDKDTDILKWFYSFFKRIRKYYGNICITTQSIGDMLMSKDNTIIKYTTGILNASMYKFIYNLIAGDIEALDNLLQPIGGLTEEEKNFLSLGEPDKCLFIAFNKQRMTFTQDTGGELNSENRYVDFDCIENEAQLW